MRVPEVLRSLVDQGVIDEVVRPLQSGKEAQVYLVLSEGEARVAKVYKDAQARSFKQRAEYMEGRRGRSSRDQRAIDKRSRHGKEQEESAWKSAEVNVIFRLHAQGVRVPTPYNFIDGVLLMELVRGQDGGPAPRLSEVALEPDTARSYFERLLREVVRMLCAGVVHADLSEYNVLVDTDGPVVIDFPQSVDAAKNQNAKKLFLRDVDNLNGFLARCIPNTPRRPFGPEIWAAFESNDLTPDMALTGRFRRSTKATDVGSLLEAVAEAEDDERRRRQASGQAPSFPRRREVVVAPARPPAGRSRGQQGPRPQGQRQGQHAQGPRPQGPRPQGPRPQGSHSQGPRPPQGPRPQGSHSQGPRPQGPRPQGPRPQGSRPHGPRSEGSRPQGGRGDGLGNPQRAPGGDAGRDEAAPKRRRRRRRKPAPP